MSYIALTISGNIGSTNAKVLENSGKTVYEVSICHNQYEGRDGSGNAINKPIWVKAIFWDEEANRTMDRLNKGGEKGIAVISGSFQVRNYVDSKGNSGTSYELKSPQLLDFIPKKDGNGTSAPRDDDF